MSIVNVCWCGHLADYHMLLDDEIEDGLYGSNAQFVCTSCAESNNFEVSCEHMFEPDNLRYLEQLSQKHVEKSS